LAPILPQILVNGSDGTATGYRSAIGTYKPEDLIGAVKRKLDDLPWIPLQPWYHKFRGTIEGDNKGNFISSGVVSQAGKIWKITELPLGKWRDNFKAYLTKMMSKGLIEDFHEQHRNEDVCFEVEGTGEVKDPMDFFSLRSSFSSQLNLLVLEGNTVRIRSFESIEEIFNHWYTYRLRLFETRRIRMLGAFREQIPFLQSKVDFIRIMLARQVPLGQKKKVMCEALHGLNVPRKFHDQLLQMSVSSFTEEKIQSIQADLESCRKSIEFYQTTTGKDLWNHDLDMLQAALPAFWSSRFEEDDDDE
jgi:DNA topoisomerase-2